MFRKSRFAAAAALAAMLIQSASPALAEVATWGQIKAQYKASTNARITPPNLTPNPYEMPEDGLNWTERGGDPGSLPIGCSITPSELIAHAHTMPAVQTAKAEFASRGYEPYTAGDAGIVGCSSTDYTAAVILAYTRPNSYIDETKAVTPMIVVVTKLLQNTAEPSALTRVSGGLVYMDAATSTMIMADDLPQYAQSDPSFDIHNGGGDTGPDPGIIRPDAPSYNVVEAVNGAKIKAFLHCTSLGSAGCVLAIAIGVAATGGVAALGLITPQGLAGIAVGCIAVASITCLANMY